MFCKFKTQQVDLETAKECVKTRLSVMNNTYCSLCVDIREVVWVSPEARKFLTTPYSQQYAKAGAILVNSPASRIIGNFFLYVTRSSRPTRIFTDKTEAVKG